MLPAIIPSYPNVSKTMRLIRPGGLGSLLGDSNSAFAWTTSATAYQIVARSPSTFATQLLRKRLEIVDNQGLPGSTSSDWQPEVAGVIAAGVDWVIYAGPTNDLTGGTNPYTLTVIPYATSVANMKSHLTQLVAAGIAVIVTPIPPQASLSNAAATQWSLTNNWMKEYCRSNPIGLHFVDIAGVNLDPTSAVNTFKSARFQDSKHYANIGAYYAGKALFQALDALLPITDYLACSPGNAAGVVGTGGANSAPTDANQLLANPLFNSVLGPGTGAASGVFASAAWTTAQTVAAGAYRKNGGNLYFTALGGICGATAPTHTSGTVSDGTVLWLFKGVNTVASNWQVLINGTAPDITGDCWIEPSDTNDQYQYQCIAVRNAGGIEEGARIISNPSAKFTDGDIVYGDCEFDLQTIANVNAASLVVTFLGSPNVTSEDGTENTSTALPEAYKGVFRPRRIAQPVGTTNITFQVIIAVGAGGGAVLRVRRAQIRRVISL